MVAETRKGKILITMLVAIIFTGGCGTGEDADINGVEAEAMGNTEKVQFVTQDGFKIIGNLIRTGKEAAIMMHQFQHDKATYNNFAQKLSEAGYTTLAIDLRGHGESLEQNGVRRRFADFSESDFRNMEKDTEAAARFLEQEGYSVKTVIGASIGANTALNFAANRGIDAVLLSPGLNYKGIDTENAAQAKGRVLIVASAEDTYSIGSSRTLKEKIPNAEMIELRNAGHGTYMFDGTNLEQKILEWMKKIG